MYTFVFACIRFNFYVYVELYLKCKRLWKKTHDDKIIKAKLMKALKQYSLATPNLFLLGRHNARLQQTSLFTSSQVIAPSFSVTDLD